MVFIPYSLLFVNSILIYGSNICDYLQLSLVISYFLSSQFHFYLPADPHKPPLYGGSLLASDKSDKEKGVVFLEHEVYMAQALALAQEAARAGEVPVGCIIVHKGQIVGRGRNRREEKQSTLSHAEVEAIRQANRTLNTWRLEDCCLYVTLEPCPMCAGAILNARIPRVYYGARDRVMGACGGVLNLFMEDFSFRPALVGGILREPCQQVLSDFFASLRSKDPDISPRFPKSADR